MERKRRREGEGKGEGERDETERRDRVQDAIGAPSVRQIEVRREKKKKRENLTQQRRSYKRITAL